MYVRYTQSYIDYLEDIHRVKKLRKMFLKKLGLVLVNDTQTFPSLPPLKRSRIFVIQKVAECSKMNED